MNSAWPESGRRPRYAGLAQQGKAGWPARASGTAWAWSPLCVRAWGGTVATRAAGAMALRSVWRARGSTRGGARQGEGERSSPRRQVDMEATGTLQSGDPLPDGGAPVAAVDSGESLQHQADEEDVRGKLVWQKGSWRRGSARGGDGSGAQARNPVPWRKLEGEERDTGERNRATAVTVGL
jgi:hypothetical protein